MFFAEASEVSCLKIVNILQKAPLLEEEKKRRKDSQIYTWETTLYITWKKNANNAPQPFILSWALWQTTHPSSGRVKTQIYRVFLPALIWVHAVNWWKYRNGHFLFCLSNIFLRDRTRRGPMWSTETPPTSAPSSTIYGTANWSTTRSWLKKVSYTPLHSHRGWGK